MSGGQHATSGRTIAGASRTAALRLVCLDLGGVLVRICRTWAEGCAAAGIEHRGPEHLPAKTVELVCAHQTGRMEMAAFARAMSDAIDGLYTPDEIAAIHRAWTLDTYDGVEQVIDDLHARGIATAALSNTNAEHWLHLPKLPAIARLHHRLVSHELGVCKPDAAAYAAVEHRTGVRGAEILFFDDLEENVEAARAFGWRAVQIDHARETAEQIRGAVEAAVGAP